MSPFHPQVPMREGSVQLVVVQGENAFQGRLALFVVRVYHSGCGGGSQLLLLDAFDEKVRPRFLLGIGVDCGQPGDAGSRHKGSHGSGGRWTGHEWLSVGSCSLVLQPTHATVLVIRSPSGS